MQTHLPEIGIFIDADNAPASQISFIMANIARHGIVTTNRAYGKWIQEENRTTVQRWYKN